MNFWFEEMGLEDGKFEGKWVSSEDKFVVKKMKMKIMVRVRGKHDDDDDDVF